MDNTTHTPHTRLMLFILAFVLLFASIVGYVVSQRMANNPQGATSSPISLRLRSGQANLQSPKPTLIPYPKQGTFTLKERSGATSVKIGSNVIIDVLATSSVKSVMGYDAIISYDETVFNRQSVESKLPSFQIFTYNRGSHVSISATKNISANEPVVFSNTPILSLVFTANKKGTYTFSAKPVGNESSKIVNEAAEVTYPEPSDLRLEIN